MEQEVYNKLFKEAGAVEMVRAHWKEESFHADLWRQRSITILITQRKTPELIRLCLESLLQFYPDIPVLIMDGDSQDESTEYLRLKQCLHPNVKIIQWDGRNSHGVMMDTAIREHIKTEFVCTMDSDIITRRGGFFEEMLAAYKTNPKLYAIGTLMLVTKYNYACGPPIDENDILRYAHPSLSIYHVETYKTFRPFADHGAPCVFNMMDAIAAGLEIQAYPVDKYCAHCSGASWTEPYRTIWGTDNDVFIRPFITFIVSLPVQLTLLAEQTSHDFDIVTLGNHRIEDVVVHYSEPVHVSNYLYDIRFRVLGEYVCWLSEAMDAMDKNTVSLVHATLIQAGAPDEMVVCGLLFIRRKLWQRREALA